MAYDEGVAQRLREIYTAKYPAVEKKMFGGIAFMVNGHMSCGVVKTSLMVRVDQQQYNVLLEYPHAREMDFTGRSLKGFLYVDPKGFESNTDLSMWVERSLDYVLSLPLK